MTEATQADLVERCVEAMREHLTVCPHSGFIEGLDEAARAIIPIVQADTRERDAVIALSAKLPRERLSCSDDESGTLISLQRQRRHTATAIRNQEWTDG